MHTTATRATHSERALIVDLYNDGTLEAIATAKELAATYNQEDVQAILDLTCDR